MRANEDVRSHLLLLHDSARSVIDQAAGHRPSDLGRILRLDSDIQLWESCLRGRPEVAQLAYARRELGFAVYSTASGLYGNAFAGLRLFLELSFASVYFSVHEFHRRKWMANRVDFSWSSALDENEGVLARSFVREFNAGAIEESAEYASRVSQVYRQCSEFMHGKYASTRLMPDTLQFSPTMLDRWSTSAIASAEGVLFLLYCRYSEELLDEHFDTLRVIHVA